jgi:membrane-bound metal-dependent hydrolase YbcI (DUF457 family)
MSSFIGHSLIAITVFKCGDIENNRRNKFIWLSWLILCVLLPDIDYLFRSLQSPNNNGIRITHSIAVSLILPVITIFFLLLKNNRKDIKVSCIQVIIAGLSHIILDMLVGVTPDPLLYPLSNIAIKLPIGLLPSAGSINIFNYYFYRNLIIELGILSPICYLLLMLCKGISEVNKFKITILLIVFLSCLFWSLNLNR